MAGKIYCCIGKGEHNGFKDQFLIQDLETNKYFQTIISESLRAKNKT
jgi:hypothetical protein